MHLIHPFGLIAIDSVEKGPFLMAEMATRGRPFCVVRCERVVRCGNEARAEKRSYQTRTSSNLWNETVLTRQPGSIVLVVCRPSVRDIPSQYKMYLWSERTSGRLFRNPDNSNWMDKSGCGGYRTLRSVATLSLLRTNRYKTILQTIIVLLHII